MTSRREFFGLMVAAPIAVPVIAKEMASNTGVPKLVNIHLTSGVEMQAFVAARAEVVNVKPVRPFRHIESIQWERHEICEVFSVSPCCELIPNRLYGAKINADGEAI